jgi:glycerophosphoryl diester phosphodiesterase
MNRPLIVAHRGASALAAENTLASFAKAIEIGADMIEFDVRRTKDGVMIAFHDPAIAGHPIRELTHREANQLVSAKGVAIPTVAEVLRLTQGRIRLDVELKEAGYEESVAGLLAQYLQPADFVVTSFNDRVIRTIKQIYPEARTGLLLGKGQPYRPLPFSFSELFPAGRVEACHADLVVAHYRLLKLGFLDRMRQKGLPVYVWTVDDPLLLQQLLRDPRVAAVITNRPDLALALWRENGG